MYENLLTDWLNYRVPIPQLLLIHDFMQKKTVSLWQFAYSNSIVSLTSLMTVLELQQSQESQKKQSYGWERKKQMLLEGSTDAKLERFKNSPCLKIQPPLPPSQSTCIQLIKQHKSILDMIVPTVVQKSFCLLFVAKEVILNQKWLEAKIHETWNMGQSKKEEQNGGDLFMIPFSQPCRVETVYICNANNNR